MFANTSLTSTLINWKLLNKKSVFYKILIAFNSFPSRLCSSITTSVTQIVLCLRMLLSAHLSYPPLLRPLGQQLKALQEEVGLWAQGEVPGSSEEWACLDEVSSVPNVTQLRLSNLIHSCNGGFVFKSVCILLGGGFGSSMGGGFTPPEMMNRGGGFRGVR